jgi:hypothetical protein
MEKFSIESEDVINKKIRKWLDNKRYKLKLKLVRNEQREVERELVEKLFK